MTDPATFEEWKKFALADGLLGSFTPINAWDAATAARNAEIAALEARVRELEEDNADLEAAHAERIKRLDTFRADAKKAIRAALGEALWNRFWGPELERLGSVVYDVWLERDAALARAVPPWTETPPAVPGFYYVEFLGFDADVVRFELEDGVLGTWFKKRQRFHPVDSFPAGTWWSGPVPRPG